MNQLPQWKAVIVADRQPAQQIAVTISALAACGWDETHIFCTRGTQILTDDSVVVHRLTDEDCGPDGEYSAYLNAMEAMTHAYARTHDYFVYAKPNLAIWEQARDYCEHALDRDTPAVWNLHTPDRLSQTTDHHRRRPGTEEDFGFLQYQPEGDLLAAGCFVMSANVQQLLHARLPRGGLRGFPTHLGETLRSWRMKLYYNVPSLAQFPDDTLRANDFVGAAYEMPNKDIRKYEWVLD